MPKRAPAPHPHGPGGKRKRVDDSQRRDRLPTAREMEKMSVREKLLAGVCFGLSEIQKQHQQPQRRGRQSYALVASLQRCMDEAFHVSPSIRPSLQDSLESGAMTLQNDVEGELWDLKVAERRKILINHFGRRMSQRKGASRRLQAVMRLANDNPFVPPAEASDGHGSGETLRRFLNSACRKHGYRALHLDLLGFMSIKVSNDFRGEPLGSVPMPPTAEPADNVSLDAKKGSLVLYESDVPDEFGRITSWLWLKICRPLASYEQPRHFPAPDMSEEQEAWTIVAIPKSQIETLEEAWQPCHAPDEMTSGGYIMESVMPRHARQERAYPQRKRRALAFRYSRDGVPGMATSKKPGDVDSALFGFRNDLDEMHWDTVQAAMKTNSCLVYALSKPGADWIGVAPEQPEQPMQSDSQGNSGKRAGAHASRRTKRSSGVRRSSSLKHEVHSEDC